MLTRAVSSPFISSSSRRPAGRSRANPQRSLLGGARATVGVLALLTVIACCFALAAGTASRPTGRVPASVGGFPGWLSGPLHGLHIGLGLYGFQTLEFILFGAWLVALIGADAVPLRLLLAGVALADLALVLGPVILSQDAFGYLSFARMGVLHGLDPYTHTASAAPQDALYRYLGWHNVHSPYGPLFTLPTYALVPLGAAGGMWALKIIAGAAAAGGTVVIARAAALSGRPAGFAAAFVGLNPALLSFAVGGAHNDLIIVLLTGVVMLALAVERPARGAAAGVLAATIKISSTLLLPFVLASREAAGRRREILIAAAIAAVIAGIIAVIGFGPHALGFVGTLRGEQQHSSQYSVPEQFARAFGISGFPNWWRHLVDALLAVVICVGLVLTWRGADWRTTAGWATYALVCSTTFLLSWYVIWVLPLAAVSRDRLLRVATVVLTAYVILFHLPFGHQIGLSMPRPRPVHRQVVHAPRARRRHHAPRTSGRLGRTASPRRG
ncbi:MAG TPA: glycosyltransferase 87 family protein [Solirubrobacteraceae bacterium]|nr:glycosyltransferase 87 family protein [Solirubrobacteraceae bacterium]